MDPKFCKYKLIFPHSLRSSAGGRLPPLRIIPAATENALSPRGKKINGSVGAGASTARFQPTAHPQKPTLSPRNRGYICLLQWEKGDRVRGMRCVGAIQTPEGSALGEIAPSNANPAKPRNPSLFAQNGGRMRLPPGGRWILRSKRRREPAGARLL